MFVHAHSPAPGVVLALIALVAALGGTGYAADGGSGSQASASKKKAASVTLPSNYTTETVGIDLPAGDYVATATTTIVSGGGAPRIARCRFVTPTPSDPAGGNGADVGTQPANFIVQIAAQTAFTLTSPGRLRLNCGYDAPSLGTTSPKAETTQLMAIAVGDLRTP